MNELRIANQSLLTVFLDSERHGKTTPTPTDASPHASRSSGLRNAGQASHILRLRVRDAKNHPGQSIISRLPGPASLLPQLESAQLGTFSCYIEVKSHS